MTFTDLKAQCLVFIPFELSQVMFTAARSNVIYWNFMS